MISGLPVAGFWSRVGASVVDVVFLWVVILLMAFSLGVIGVGISSLGLLLVWAAPIVYYVWGWSSWSGGQTFGKRALNQRLIGANGQPLSKLRAFGRLLGACISGLPLGLGYLWAAWDPEKQTWHDKMVGSYVVKAAAPLAEASHAVASLPDGARMPCPRCGESIPINARVCRFCGVEFEPSETAPKLVN